MALTSLMVAAILSLVPADADADALIRRLGAPRYADREAAQEALEKLGPEALPALRKARADDDPEIRNRVRALYERIERSTLLTARSVRLDFKDETLSRILGEVGKRSGQRLGVTPDLELRSNEIRLTLVEPEPLPFWKAVDRIGSAAGLRIGTVPPPMPGQAEAPLLFSPAVMRTPAPTFDQGPFRVRLLGFHYQHDISFDDNAVAARGRGATEADTEQFSVRLRVAAEPRLMISINGTPTIAEAVDDRGQNLVAPEPTGNSIRSTTFVGLNATSTLELQSNLARPTTPGGRIKVLKGTIPLQIAARRADALELPLTTPDAKVRNEDASLRLISLKPQAFNRQSLIEISVRLPSVPSAETDPFGARAGLEPYHFEVLDREGRAVAWYLSSSSYDGNEARLILTTMPNGRVEATTPAVLRYHSTIRTTTEVPFEFRNVRIP